MKRKTLVFDTNVCGKLAGCEDVRRVTATLNRKYRIGASANTVLELLLGVCRSNAEHFDTHKQRIRVAVGASTLASATVLNYPVARAVQHIGGRERPDDARGMTRLKQYVRTVLQARSLEELRSAGVRFEGSQFVRTLKCDVVEDDLCRGKTMYSGPLNDAKSDNLALDSPEAWAENINTLYHLNLTSPHIDSLARAFSAAYEYQRTVWTMARTGSFKPENHENDWIDWNQLLYLADPDLLFITEEKKIRDRCRRSEQSSRVLLWSELASQEDLHC